MAVVGDAYVVVRAITNRVRPDIEKAFSGLDRVGEKAGKDASRGFQKGTGGGDRMKLFGKGWFQNAELARQQFRRLTIAQNFLFAAIPGVLGAIGSLGSGLTVLVGILGNAARGSIVLVAALGSLGQAAITAGLAFKGVGEALSAGLDSQNSSTAATRAQEAATRRLRDARLDLKRLIEEEKPEALAEARERAVRAEEAAAAALRSSERAVRTYNDAQEETADALEDLNRARDRAREKLQQLRFEVEGGAISEKRARLEFEKARDSLQRVQDLPPNSRARQEAELAFAEAELNLRKAIDSNADLKKEEEAATQAGIEGSQDVVAAKERIADAQQAETDAGINAAIAARDAGRAQQEAAEAAADAAAGGSVERDLNRRIADAREQVQLAEQAAADAANGGFNAYADALSKLSPEAQQFVKFLVSQQDAFDGLRAAAGRQLFPQLETALTIIIGKFDELEPLIEETGAILGRLAMDFAETFFQGENFERLKDVWGTNNVLLENLGGTVINLLEGVLILLDAAEPLITAFGDWALNTSEAWTESLRLKDETGELGETFERVGGRIERLAGIFGTYREAFGTIFDVINQPGGAGDQLLTYFEDASTRFNDFIQQGAEDGSLDTFFSDSVENFTKVLDLIGNIIGGLLDLGAQPGTGQFLDSLNEVTDIFNELGLALTAEDGPTAKLGEFLEEFATLISNLTQSDAISIFFESLTGALEIINSVLENEVVQSILKFIGVIGGVLLAAGALNRAFKFVGRVIGGVFALLFGGPKKAAAVFKTLLTKVARIAVTGGKIAAFFARAFLFVVKFAGPIGFIVSLLLTAVPLIIKNWDKIKEWFIGLGEKVSEIFSAVFNFFKEKFTEAYEAVSTFFTETFLPWIASLPGKFAEAAKAVFEWFGEKLSAAWDFIVNFFKTVIRVYFIDLPNFLFNAAGDVFGWLGDLIGDAWDNVSNFFTDTIFPFFANLPQKLADTAGAVWDFLKDTFKGALNFVIDKWNNFKLELRLPDSIFGISLGAAAGKGFTINTPNIPRLAQGGVVQPSRSGTLALIGEAGRAERVEPLDSAGLSQRDRAIIDRLSGGRGTTINVYPSAGMDERELAELVSKRLAFQLRRGAA